MFSRSDRLFMTAAAVSFVASVALWFFFDKSDGLFVGLWVPSILALWCGIRLTLAAHYVKLHWEEDRT